MTMTKTQIGTKPDGTPFYHYATDGHAILTGPITGKVVTKDGTEYDVTDEVVEVPIGAGGTEKVVIDDDGTEVEVAKHVGEVSFLIGERYATEGHPHLPGQAFIHDHPLAGKPYKSGAK